MSDSDWDDDYYPNMPRPRFRSPLRHAQRKITKSEVQPVDDEGQYEKKSRTVKVLHVGHSTRFEHTGDIFTSCTVALIKGYKFNIIVDTMNAWDGAKLENILLGIFFAIYNKNSIFNVLFLNQITTSTRTKSTTLCAPTAMRLGLAATTCSEMHSTLWATA